MQRQLEPSVFAVEIDSKQVQMQQKLSTMVADLQIKSLKISVSTLVALVGRQLNAFALNDEDLGHTEICEHEINTGDKPPFREKLRPLPFSR